MWCEDAAAFRAWADIKHARTQEPVALMRERFGARFLVMPRDDTTPGRPPGETARHIALDLERHERPDQPIRWVHAGPWLACRLPDA
jgi:hypothetical protein